MKKYIAGLAVLLLSSACEKEIDMKYRTIKELYVIEGGVSENGARVLITKTRDMNDGEPVRPTGVPLVSLSGSDGYSASLQYGADGHYRAPMGFGGTSGTTYTLTVAAEGQEFVSSSTMHSPGRLESVIFMLKPEITEKHLLCSFSVEDEGGVDNYYSVRLNKNGRKTMQYVITDKGHDGGSVPIIIPVRFSRGERPIPGEGAGEDRVFRKGDTLEIELRTIDRPVYDYIYSLSISGNTSSNPLKNFSGECLGYFSAFSTDSYSRLFDPDAMITDGPEDWTPFSVSGFADGL